MRISIRNYRNLLASRSDSNKVRMSPSRTGPFTFLMMERVGSFKNSTFTCVHCPWDPVRPSTLITRAKMTGLSIFNYFLVGNVWFCDEGLHKKTVATTEIQNDTKRGTYKYITSISDIFVPNILLMNFNCSFKISFSNDQDEISPWLWINPAVLNSNQVYKPQN